MLLVQNFPTLSQFATAAGMEPCPVGWQIGAFPDDDACREKLGLNFKSIRD
jgi:hypothetical protein